MQEWYHWWWSNPKRMTKKEIKEMIDNMKKSSVISKRSKQYHQKEEIEAEDILNKLMKDD